MYTYLSVDSPENETISQAATGDLSIPALE
jgi:hypothetical protein